MEEDTPSLWRVFFHGFDAPFVSVAKRRHMLLETRLVVSNGGGVFIAADISRREMITVSIRHAVSESDAFFCLARADSWPATRDASIRQGIQDREEKPSDRFVRYQKR